MIKYAETFDVAHKFLVTPHASELASARHRGQGPQLVLASVQTADRAIARQTQLGREGQLSRCVVGTREQCAPSPDSAGSARIFDDAIHLPRWTYVPDAALTILLGERPQTRSRTVWPPTSTSPSCWNVPLRRRRSVIHGPTRCRPPSNGLSCPARGSLAHARGQRMRARGVVASSDLASLLQLADRGAGTLVVATLASGGSVETLDSLSRLPAAVSTGRADQHACVGRYAALRCRRRPRRRTRRSVGWPAAAANTPWRLLSALEWHLAGGDTVAQAESVTAAAAAAQLMTRNPTGVPSFSRLLLGPTGSHFAAPPHRRTDSARSSGTPSCCARARDCSHVDVQLTRTTDYRLVVFAGSPWEAQLAGGPGGGTVVGVGGTVPGARCKLRYPGDTDDDVRLLTEVLVPELIAARAWQAAPRSRTQVDDLLPG
jgi:hypothetical protein